MWRRSSLLFLVVNLLACPYLCSGLVAGCCDDPGCSKNAPKSDRSTPPTPNNPDPCNDLGSSCICTGATTDESGRVTDQGFEFEPTLCFDSCILTEAFSSSHPLSPLTTTTRWPASTGPRLRALVGSFVL